MEHPLNASTRPWNRFQDPFCRLDIAPITQVLKPSPVISYRTGAFWYHRPMAEAVLSEQEFRVKADEAIESARRALMRLADAEDFEVEIQGGVLNVLFEEPTEARFVVSPNAPVRQIWVSALVRSFKLPWSAELGAFALDGETLTVLLDRLAHQHLAR
jgi:iron donor protein CyaY